MTFKIINNKNTTEKDIITQLAAIREFPASVKIYDRAFTIGTKDELLTLKHGIEIGYYLATDLQEARDGRGRE